MTLMVEIRPNHWVRVDRIAEVQQLGPDRDGERVLRVRTVDGREHQVRDLPTEIDGGPVTILYATGLLVSWDRAIAPALLSVPFEATAPTPIPPAG